MLKTLLIIVSLCYPLLVYFLLRQVTAAWLLPLMFALLLWRACSSRDVVERRVLLLALVIAVALVLWLSPTQTLKLYPVLMNVSMLMLFALSLRQKHSMIERIARLKEPNLSAEGVRYTRCVTWVWTGFFACNGVVALATVFMSDQIWGVYNGVLAYALIGILLAGEWLVRRRIKTSAVSE
ncbi:hypothetical protein WH50_12080 [Pokkaliibacter plantistimulans]|uniref:DNA gyrase subunit B n=1 Tax=Pokkaliibacter plantistimulans TaxID=1635171 RepID=A0ABX5LXF2_9GAMM|nr:hypothetical protein [Pokkaliibacter plantistimulans]PXF30976.1 hypothetical protein WH50_12080 [Pokkaliibacter plantistimulans]